MSHFVWSQLPKCLIVDILGKNKVQPGQLEIEITETTVMKNIEHAIKTLKQLKDIGVRIAMDDFGTGYSSLTNLRRIPLDTLKIDKSFIQDIEHSADSQSIVQAILTLGHILNLTITAEGVETNGQLGLLRQYACDEVQGFYFSRPVPEQEALGMLADGNSNTRKLRDRLALDSSFL